MKKTDLYPDYNWKKVPTGSTFTAVINNTKSKGRIFKEKGRGIFLCQNATIGKDSPNKLGYKFSWFVRDGRPEDLCSYNVGHLEVFLPEEGYKHPPIDIRYFGEYRVKYVNKNAIKVGCTRIEFEKVREVYRKMNKLRKKK